MTDFPRFKHCTSSFNELRDKIPRIRQWFQSSECIELPLTDYCSRYFWKREPSEFHNFDTILAINNNADDDLCSDLNAEEIQDDIEDSTDPLTEREFESSSHWFHFTNIDSNQICAICTYWYEEQCRVSVLDCNHQYHSDCIERWLTTGTSQCPICRFNVRTSN